MKTSFYSFIIFFSLCFSCFTDQANKEYFQQKSKRAWKEVFHYDSSNDWKTDWFLDGEDALVSSQPNYFEINTLDRNELKRIYAVLWTKKSFEGDLRIEYDFKNVSSNYKGVNILYIQASGDGEHGYDPDIMTWSKKRSKAPMSDYFLNMNTYHMSYAAFGNKPQIDYKDYIRGRRYLPLANNGMKNTPLTNEYHNTGLFKDQQWVHVTIIKKEKEFWAEFTHPQKNLVCHFINEDKEGIQKGRIGLRLMPNRVSHFKNFTISVPQK